MVRETEGQGGNILQTDYKEKKASDCQKVRLGKTETRTKKRKQTEQGNEGHKKEQGMTNKR